MTSANNYQSRTTNQRGFTVLELMVGIVIFTVGLLGAYLLVQSSESVSVQSKNEIVGANIMREQIELLKNNRDSNWLQYKNWDSAQIGGVKTPLTSGWYTVENNFNENSPVSFRSVNVSGSEKDMVVADTKKPVSVLRLCIDSLGRYTHDCSWNNQKTPYFSYLEVQPLTTKDSSNNPIPVGWAFKIVSHFVSIDQTYRSYLVSTIVTDWKNKN